MLVEHSDSNILNLYSNEIKNEFIESLYSKIDPKIELYKESHSLRNQNSKEIFLTFRIKKSELDSTFLSKMSAFKDNSNVVEWGIEASSVEDTFLAIIDRF